MTVVDHAHGTVTQLWTELLGHAPILLAETRNGAQGASDRTALQTVLEVFPRMGPSSAAWTAWVQRRTTLVSPGHGNPSAVPNGFPLPPAGTAPPPQRRTALSEPRTSAVCRRGSLRVPEGLLAVETMLGWAELLDQLAACTGTACSRISNSPPRQLGCRAGRGKGPLRSVCRHPFTRPRHHQCQRARPPRERSRAGSQASQGRTSR